MSHYLDWNYVSEERFTSFYWQISEALAFEPSSVLEIGRGSGVTHAILATRGVVTYSVDIEPLLQPDVVGSVQFLPIRSDSVDVALCCQVLEHLDFVSFPHSIKDLARVASKGVVISLPDAYPFYKVGVTMPFIGRKSVSMSRIIGPDLKARNLNPSHKWEIGRFGVTPRSIMVTLTDAGLEIMRHYRVESNPYHHFFIARKTVRKRQ